MRDGLNELHDDERGDDNDPEDASDEGQEFDLSDGHVRGLLGGYALGVLDPEETELVARHISACATCRAELSDYSATVGLLAFAAPVHQVPLRARANLLGKLSEIGTANVEQMIVLRPEPTPTPAPRRSWRAQLTAPQWSRTRMAAFAAVPLLLLIVAVTLMGNRINDQQDELDAIKIERAETDRFVTGVEQGDANAVQAVIPSSAARGAQGKLIVDRDENSALLLVVGLPQPAQDETYIVWLDLTNNTEYAKAGPLAVETDGRAKLILNPPGPIALYDGVLVTAEIDPDIAAPTGPELMTASIMAD